MADDRFDDHPDAGGTDGDVEDVVLERLAAALDEPVPPIDPARVAAIRQAALAHRSSTGPTEAGRAGRASRRVPVPTRRIWLPAAAALALLAVGGLIGGARRPRRWASGRSGCRHGRVRRPDRAGRRGDR
ncbi:MAG: hypothetical protein R2715_20335 [Ilumatobacteraceae bacterium]